MQQIEILKKVFQLYLNVASLEVFPSLVTGLALVQVIVRPADIIDVELGYHPLPFALSVVRGALHPVLNVDPVVVGLASKDVGLVSGPTPPNDF